jgi:DNA-binding GntR family transcriptional regulator
MSSSTSTEAYEASYPDGDRAGATAAVTEPERSAASLLGRLLNTGERRDSLVGMIAGEVGTDIVEGRLPPGSDLNSVELARRFGTSRTPVREALMLLENEGLVVIPPRRRPRVAEVDSGPVREIYEVRALLLGQVAELVCENATDDGLQELRDLYARMQEAADAGDVDRYFWANVAFSDRSMEIAGNATLRRILESLGLRVLQLRHLSMSLPSRLSQSADDQGRLLRAYEERDARLATALSSGLVLSALRAIEQSGFAV